MDRIDWLLKQRHFIINIEKENSWIDYEVSSDLKCWNIFHIYDNEEKKPIVRWEPEYDMVMIDTLGERVSTIYQTTCHKQVAINKALKSIESQWKIRRKKSDWYISENRELIKSNESVKERWWNTKLPDNFRDGIMLPR
tara:strand:+ start:157 stop:573 length:417 start_codon:yes stop_codon:yes gene_type:complete